MPAMPLRQSRLVLAAAALVLVAGCGTMNNPAGRVRAALTPYKVEVVQGNFISREQVQVLQKGMSAEQVRNILGTPLVTSLFHGERWDYVFTLRRQGLEPQQRRLTVFFSNGTLDRFEGDTMPSESEFVATLEKRKPGRIPRLEATEEELRRFNPGKAATPAAAAAGPATTSYPPLESPAR